MKTKWGMAIALSAALLVGAAAQAEDIYQPSASVGAEGFEELTERMQQDAQTYAPRVTTLSNGVQIQRTPSTWDGGEKNEGFRENLSFNMKYLQSDRRGCGACHTDLGELVETLDYPHLHVKSGMDQETTASQCMLCHDYSTSVMDSMGFGSLMHMFHSSSNKAFSAMGGDCWSCHYATEDGNGMALWDDVKHDVMRGITAMTNEQVASQMAFTWDQDTVLNAEDIFSINWYYDEPGVNRYMAGLSGVKPDPTTDGLYDQWTISVDGEVENPFEMTIREMIDTFGLKTDKMTLHCGVNYNGGSWIGNFEITGISIKDIMEYAGVRDSANTFENDGSDGSTYFASMADLMNNDGYIVLEVGGQPLPYAEGYPAQVWVGGQPAWNCVKQVNKLTFLADDDIESFGGSGFFDENGVSYFKPNVGLRHVREGQIIKAGEPFTFEGYADAWETPITALEFSFDRGQSWVRYETPDANVKNWVYWRLTWQAPEAGAYTIMIRSVDADGNATQKPLDYLINVQ